MLGELGAGLRVEREVMVSASGLKLAIFFVVCRLSFSISTGGLARSIKFESTFQSETSVAVFVFLLQLESGSILSDAGIIQIHRTQ